MPAVTYKQQTLVRDAVETYLERYGYTSTRKIAEWVRARLNLKKAPAPSTILRLVNELKAK
jgi:hypothetical protein